MSKCPGNTAEAKAVGYVSVFIDVTRIIVVNEVVPERLAKNEPCKHCQTDADADGYPAADDLRWAYRSSDPVHVSRDQMNHKAPAFVKRRRGRRMPNDEGNPNDKTRKAPRLRRVFWQSSFVIDSSFVISFRISFRRSKCNFPAAALIVGRCQNSNSLCLTPPCLRNRQ